MESKPEGQSKFDLFQKINLKRRQDGSAYKSRQEMVQNYRDSRLFYPLSVLWNLEYCNTIIKKHFINSLYFAFPFTLVGAYAFNPKIRTEGMRGRPFVYYVSLYILIYGAMCGYFLLDSLVFCDYCKPWSYVYDTESGREQYLKMLKTKIKQEQGSSDIQYKKTRDKGLKDEEI